RGREREPVVLRVLTDALELRIREQWLECREDRFRSTRKQRRLEVERHVERAHLLRAERRADDLRLKRKEARRLRVDRELAGLRELVDHRLELRFRAHDVVIAR